MRKIKFRAWDTLWKQFCNPSLFKVSGSGYVQIDRERHGIFASTRELILNQWTGREDKNSKDIYEGDIVRFSWNPILGGASENFEFELPVEYDDV